MRKKHFFLFCSVLFFCFSNLVFSQTDGAVPPVRVYPHLMNPRKHPDDDRKAVRPPDAATFKNRVQFTALRSLGPNYREEIEKYTKTLELGNVLWPTYDLLHHPELEEVVRYIKEKELYLFDIWGFVPGSGPGGYWQQFEVDPKTTSLFERELADRWLGMDNGEQDGRYVGGYAGQMSPVGASREEQYLNFQHHFERLGDLLGNKLSTLVSLNFGHYFLKEGTYSLIGAETAQGLPNTQVYYSFIRGAGKQYGVPWFGNASVWNRWGWKDYSGAKNDNAGETNGTSLSLLKRLMYSHLMYNSVAVGFESSFFRGDGSLSPIGEIQRSANRWVGEHGDCGVMHTPVAVMVDFFSGWSYPRHLYTGNVFCVWGNLPYEEGDYLTDGLLNLFYPGYRDASYYHDESGFITPTPFGDQFDCLMSDAPGWLLRQYPVLIIGGTLKGTTENRDKLEEYVRQGGHLVLSAGSLRQFENGIGGLRAGGERRSISGGPVVLKSREGTTTLEEKHPWSVLRLELPENVETLASCGDEPVVVRRELGRGRLTVFASPYGLAEEPAVPLPIRNKEDQPLVSPFPLLEHVRELLDEIVRPTTIFELDPKHSGSGLSFITSRQGPGRYRLALCNNSWTEQPFRIASRVGPIREIRELTLDCSERKANGFVPNVVKDPIGENGPNVIGGGDVRLFDISLSEQGVEEIPETIPTKNPTDCGLVLRNPFSLQREILLRPTFFQHFDTVMIDWKYLNDKDESALHKEAGWLGRQKLNIVVDLSSGINLFPDLRLIDNDPAEYAKSRAIISGLLKKMEIFGAKNLVLTTHRVPENNFTPEQHRASLQKTLKAICAEAAAKKIDVHLRLTTDKSPSDLAGAKKLAEEIDEPNFWIAPSLGLLLARDKEGTFEGLKHRIVLVSGYERDKQGRLWNLHQPLARFAELDAARKIVQAERGSLLILDACYSDQDEEYADGRIIAE